MAQFLWIVVRSPILTCKPLQSRWLTPKVEVGNLQWLVVHWPNLRGTNPTTLSCKAICSFVPPRNGLSNTRPESAQLLRLLRMVSADVSWGSAEKYAENCWALALGGFPAPMFFSSWTLIGHFYIPFFWYTELDPWLEFLSNTNWLLADIYK